jgi:hypothetical protein
MQNSNNMYRGCCSSIILEDKQDGKKVDKRAINIVVGQRIDILFTPSSEITKLLIQSVLYCR